MVTKSNYKRVVKAFFDYAGITAAGERVPCSYSLWNNGVETWSSSTGIGKPQSREEFNQFVKTMSELPSVRVRVAGSSIKYRRAAL